MTTVLAALDNSLDLLAFSGGVGENRDDVRDAVTKRVRFVGDFQVAVVPARELVIAEAAETLLA